METERAFLVQWASIMHIGEMYRQLDITAEEHGFVKNYEGLIKAESIRKMRGTQDKRKVRLRIFYKNDMG